MQPTTATPKTPVIKCLPRPDFLGGMMFFGPFCQRWHYHGRGKGHRCAHCHGNTPFDKTGYKIKMMSMAELREFREAITEWLKLPPETRRQMQE